MKNPLIIVELNEHDPIKANRVAVQCGFKSYKEFVNDPEYAPAIKEVFPETYEAIKQQTEEDIERKLFEKFEKKQIDIIVSKLDPKIKEEFEDIVE
jgi:transcriptional accessory protein Tex/SPT6